LTTTKAIRCVGRRLARTVLDLAAEDARLSTSPACTPRSARPRHERMRWAGTVRRPNSVHEFRKFFQTFSGGWGEPDIVWVSGLFPEQPVDSSGEGGINWRPAH
jgi:hypothetical protein